MRKRWTIYIVGVESRTETELTFMRAHRRKTVEKRYARLQSSGMTRYEIRKVRRPVRR